MTATVSNNTRIHVIAPYRYRGGWVFDDEDHCLLREALIAGADNVCDAIAQALGDVDTFRLAFSADPFPGVQHRFDWIQAEHGGNWYWSLDHQRDLWLCPALSNYFDPAPAALYAKADVIAP